MDAVGTDAVITIAQAAGKLGVSIEQMLAWNMVVVHEVDGKEVVPLWSTDPMIARYLPTLSQVFQGEALSYCLRAIRPMGDDRNGLDALREGKWQMVLDRLQALRARFELAMMEEDFCGIAGIVQAQAEALRTTLH